MAKIKMLIGRTAGQIEDVVPHAAEALVASGQATWADGTGAHPARTYEGYGMGPKKGQLVPSQTPPVDLGQTLEQRLPPYPGKAAPTTGPPPVAPSVLNAPPTGDDPPSGGGSPDVVDVTPKGDDGDKESGGKPGGGKRK